MKLWVFLVRRIILLIPILIGVMTITFVLIAAIPIYPNRIEMCRPSSQHNPLPQPGTPAYNQTLTLCGLNAPVEVQYVHYIGNIFTGQWGYLSGNSCVGPDAGCPGGDPLPQPVRQAVLACGNGGSPCAVTTLIGAWLPYTIELALLSLFIIILASLPLGTYSAVKRNRPLDQATRIFSFSGFALPGFLLASFMVVAAFFVIAPTAPHCYTDPLLVVWGNWPPAVAQSDCLAPSGGLPFMNSYGGTAPTGLPLLDAAIYATTHPSPQGNPGYWWNIVGNSFARLLLPAVVIAYGSIAGILRYVRNSMLEVMNMDYVRTARAKGVIESKVIRKHAGRNSLNATVTVLGLTFAFFMQGFAVTEYIFQFYGVGAFFTYALIPNVDIGVLTASTLMLTIMVVIANLIVDILYGYLDPRVRLG